jgi:3-(methylthio)propanoyl-CoA dehydrogenase
MSKGFYNGDMQLFIDHRVDWVRYFQLKRGAEVDSGEEVGTYRTILQTIGEVCEAIESDSRDHWYEEVRLEGPTVIVPPHIATGYKRLRDAGLICLTLSPEFGGYGLPLLLSSFYLEMVAQADASLMTIVGLQGGVAQDIEKYGSDELRHRYLPDFASGELQGAMDLTEPQAGSDLGAIMTRVTEENGRYVLDGEKIFITNGGASIHLVLARDAASYDQSKGTTSGLSLMLCPRTLPDGRPNGIKVVRVERKLGIHGSPTCVIDFDRAEAFLLGTRGQGFRAMLDLMNNARLGVAAQAIGIAESAFREALEFAQARVQFDQPIVHQPLVKSMLAHMRLNIQAARALLYRTSALIDMADALRTHLATERGQTDPQRTALQAELERDLQLVRFFTPLCKYHATELSNHVTRQAIQVHGGLGYMAETVLGHRHADSIITTIYEGTSEIQASFALKEMSKGALFTTLEDVRTELLPLRERHEQPVQLVFTGIEWINGCLGALMGDPQYALLNAKRLCEMVIDVVVAAELLLQGDVGDEPRRELARSFANLNIPAVELNARRITGGDVSRLKNYDCILGLG